MSSNSSLGDEEVSVLDIEKDTADFQDDVSEESPLSTITDRIRRRNKIKNGIYFYIGGVCNNFAFTTMLQCATELLPGASGFVLLCNVVPNFLMNLFAPQFIHHLNYTIRMFIMAIASFLGFVVVIFSPYQWLALLGVVSISISTCVGEMTQLSLCSLYDENALTCWASGTGSSGVFSTVMYELLRSSKFLGLPSDVALASISWVPWLNLFLYFLLRTAPTRVAIQGSEAACKKYLKGAGFKLRFKILRPFLIDILWLALVYFSQYTINVGVASVMGYTLGIDHNESYRINNILYQIGVFFSRTAIGLFQIKFYGVFSALQCVILIFEILHVTSFRWIVHWSLYYAISFYVGLQGGSVYSNAMYHINHNAGKEYREFIVAAALVGNSTGLFSSSLASVAIERWLSRYVK